MPITEVVFVVFKQDLETLEILRTSEHKMFETVKGVPGMLHARRGVLLEENGQAVDPSTQRRVFSLEYENAESFHNFSPDSEAFQGFSNFAKPLVAEIPTPQLFQAENRSTDCLSSNFTQIIKCRATSGTEETWKKIEKLFGGKKPSYHANGIEKAEGEFLGLIGWSSKEEYELFGKLEEFLDLVKQLNADNFLVQLSKIDI